MNRVMWQKLSALFFLPVLLLAAPTVPPIIRSSVNGGLVVTASSYLALSGAAVTLTSNRPVVYSSPISGTLTATDSMHATYHAPPHIPMSAEIYGCPAGPVDSVL